MSYELLLTASAGRELERLDATVATRIEATLTHLARWCDVIPHESLSGPLRGLYRLRVGTYRVIYEYDQEEQRIIVHRVGHRRDIYER